MGCLYISEIQIYNGLNVYFQIYNGMYVDSPQVGRYCGDNPPSSVSVAGNTARVVFRTDASITNGGFSASYTSNEAACK